MVQFLFGRVVLSRFTFDLLCSNCLNPLSHTGAAVLLPVVPPCSLPTDLTIVPGLSGFASVLMNLLSCRT